MVKSELVRVLSEKLADFETKNVELAVNCLLDQIVEALARNDRIEIRGFGSFSLHHQAPRDGRNPKTGEPISIPKKARVHFKVGKGLKDRVNAARDQKQISD